MSEIDNKRYYWLRLKKDFFNSLRIKKLRKLGSDFVIVYLKLQLLSLEDDGYLYYKGIEKSFAEEIALELDEDLDKVQLTLSYLQSSGLLTTNEDDCYFLPYVEENTGSETNGANRKRLAKAEKQQLLESQSGQGWTNGGKFPPEKEIYKNIREISKEKEIKEKESKTSRFTKPTLDEVKNYIYENGYSVDAQYFYDYYESNGWKVGKNAMKDWKACVRTWNTKNKSNTPNQKKVEEWHFE